MMHKGGANKPDSLSVPDIPDREADEEALLEGIRFWDGESWVTGPAVNRAYLKQAGGGG